MNPQFDTQLSFARGVKILHDPVRNKGTAFTEEERDLLGLRGLLPPRVHSQTEQVRKIMETLRNKPTDLERYIFLIGLQDRNENLFYKTIMDHIEETMPLIYTPTVGKACQLYGHLFRRPRGLYISAQDKGHIRKVLANWPHRNARIIVVTDGERILGLGDLGADGMGIPVGKLSLYTACAGINPTQCLPITLDVGTNNTALLEDPLYLGLPQHRIIGQDYDDLIDEFIIAVQDEFPDVIIQLEDFATTHAFDLLERYRREACLFDDDIQGTGAVALAGIFSALRLTDQAITDQKVLFLGTGEAGIGIGDLLVASMVESGLTPDQSRHRCWYFDSKGLVTDARQDLARHKRAYAHSHEPISSFLEAIEVLKPTAIIGVSGQPSMFDQAIIERLSVINKRPIIFALSNPTSKSECTAREAYTWSQGRAIFASGSPFEPVECNGKTLTPGQGNNAYIFPGVGLGVMVSRSRSVTDRMFLRAAHALAEQVSDADLAKGRIYPSLKKIRDVSLSIATAVAREALDEGLAQIESPANLRELVRESMYEPTYPLYAEKVSQEVAQEIF
jgi:malate dehydrogenase (oxaloacetate-decarboxylating)(NADP+)